MSILIRGMEMPTEDEEIIIRISSDGAVMTEYALPITWAKAVPVPPHGQLIDADALMKQLQSYWNCNDDFDFANKLVWKAIETAPTIVDAEEGET